MAISGIGGLGHLALQYAKIFGGTVAAIDITDEKLQLAKELGADIVIDARTEDPAAVLQGQGGADVAIGLAVDDKSFATAYAGLRRGGRLVLVALPAAGTLSIPVFDTVLNGTSVIGSIVGTRADLADVFSLHAAGPDQGDLRDTRPGHGQRVDHRCAARPGQGEDRPAAVGIIGKPLGPIAR